MAIYLFDMEPLTRGVFWASYIAWFLIEFWIFRRDRRTAKGEQKDRGSFFVIVLMVFIGITVAFNAPYLWRWARIELPPGSVFWTAICLIWSGMILRSWAVITLGRHFRTSVRILDEHKLVTSGPYRVLRHPAYTGGLLTLSGIGLAFGNWISFAAPFFGLLLAYAVRIAVEKSALRARFGAEFEAHRKRTWSIIPLVW